MEFSDKIYVAGHNGMVGSAITRNLIANGYQNIVFRSSSQLDLRNQAAVLDFFENEQPQYVFLAAARVGGIHANNVYRASFLYDNIVIAANVIEAAYRFNVKKLLFLGSTCIYPKFSAQPIREEYLLTGELEQTNEPYAIAKIAGVKLCESYCDQYGANFISAMPTNLYGTGDNYHSENAHVLPALIRRFHEAQKNGDKQVVVWGSGRPKREFLFADDLADACVFLMNNYNQRSTINVGSGEEISIAALAGLVKKVTQFEGDIVFDSSRPDGTPRKLADVTKIHNLGWHHMTMLEDGIYSAYRDFLSRYEPSTPAI
jgi:Nucleoside-diphosphate-sugar epimerases